jgi:cytidylate kinase
VAGGGENEGMSLVTLSAAYGAGGSRVGPALAERLGVAFVDRAIPTAVAERLAIPLDEALAHDQSMGSVLERLLVTLAPAGQAYGAVPVDVLAERDYRRATEEVLLEHAAGGRAVLLGRAAAIVLRDDPRALHVRLHGPRERRLAQAMEVEGVDRETAERHLEETDRAREAYVRHFYRCDPNDAGLYHLVIDSTTIPLDSCVELIALAARARGGAAATGGA